MAGTHDSIMDSFDELNHKKVKKTQVDVRGANAKKFMDMFNKGEIPEGISASDRYWPILNIVDLFLVIFGNMLKKDREHFLSLNKGTLHFRNDFE